MEITLTNQLKVWLFHLIGTLLMLICVWYFNFNTIILKVFLCYWIVYTIPAAYLHIEYWLKNRGQEIEITPYSLTVVQDGIAKKYSTTDLEKITVYKSASMDKGGIPLLSTESFFYARIKPKEGEDIIITNLMSPDVDKVVRQLSGVPYERKKTGFAFIALG